MNNKKYYILGGVLILLLIIAGFLFFGGGGKKPEPKGQINLVWWKTFETSENMQQLIADYESSYKNVRITFVKKDINTYEQELVDALASGTGPDIFSIHNDWLYKHKDKISPLPDQLMSIRSYKDTFVDVAGNDFIWEGRIYAIPLAVDILGLYYNKDILGSAKISSPPTTWPELVLSVEKITKVSQPGSFLRSGIAMGTAGNVNRAVDTLNLLMLQNGTKFYSDDLRSAQFDRQQTVEGQDQSFNPGTTALTFYTQFAQPSKTSYTWNIKSDFSVDAFTQGKLGMMINYQYMEPAIKSKSPNLSWGVAVMPQISADADKINFANYWGETVAKSSKNASSAWDFLNFISSRTELAKYYEKHKQVASRKDMLADQLNDVDLGPFAESALTARSVYKKDASLFEAVFLKMIDDVILRNFEPEDAIRNASAQINLNLQKQ